VIILASKSPARAELLRRAGVAVSVQGSGVDEAPLKAQWLLEGATPLEVAERLAVAKAHAVAQRAHPGGSSPWVIGADQTAEFQGRLLDKAESAAQALDRLRAMRGLPHQLHSAVTLTNSVQTWSCVSTATLHVRDFGDVWLDAYAAAAGAALTETVGGYELESVGVQLFDRIEGDYFAILGLPLTELLGALRRFDALPG
jgi:septum formation protein